MIDDRSSIQARRSISPTTGKSFGSPYRRSPPNCSLNLDISSPGRRSNTAHSHQHDADVSRFFSQTSKLRNTVSGEVLEQNFREKLADLSRALVSEKEANISLEKRYCEEVEYRANLEGKLLEYERLLRTAEESLLQEKSFADMRESELTTELEKEKGYRQISDQQVISAKVEISTMSKEHQDHVRETSRKIQDLTSEVSRHSHDASSLRKEMEENKNAADRRQQRLIEDLRQTEDQRAHLDQVYHASVTKVAEVESNLASVRQELNGQIKTLKDKLEKEAADRHHMEEAHLRETRALNERIRMLGESLQEEQEVLSKTKEDLQNTTLGRDRLQTRLNHLMDEATEMRKEMSAKRAEYEGKLENEVDLREKTQAELSDKNVQCEQVNPNSKICCKLLSPVRRPELVKFEHTVRISAARANGLVLQCLAGETTS